MYEFFIFMLGFISCMALLYAIGRSRHAGHGDGDTKTASGPSSRTNTSENVIPIVKKGT